MSDQERKPEFAGPPIGRFAGDPALWVQPSELREHPGDRDLGFGRLERWRSARRLVTASGLGEAWSGLETRLHVHSIFDPHCVPEKAPHAMVDAQDLAFDFSKLYPARTLRFRRGFKLGAERLYHRYRPGALLGSAPPAREFAVSREWTDWTLRRRPGLRRELFSRDYFQDIFDSYRCWDGGAQPAFDETVEHPVLFVTREGKESRNLFHTATDLLGAFEAALVVGAPRVDYEVVILDNAPPAPFDRLWQTIFAPRHGVRRVGDFAGRRVLFRRAIFCPPGYHSLMFAGIWGENPAPHRVGLLDAFARLVLRTHGIDPTREPAAGGALRAALIVRRPYEGHPQMARQLANEEACLDALRSAGFEGQAIDFARHPIEEQIRIASQTDLLAGVHGAGLLHLLWMPPHGGVLEVDPDGGRGWRCFRHLATWTDRDVKVVNGQVRRIPGGSLVTADPAGFEAAARELAARVRARRSALSRAAPMIAP